MSEDETISVENLLRRMNTGWDELQAFISTLTPEQLTTPTDAAGWTAKDHLMHLAVWEDGMYALFSGQGRHKGMNVDQALWESGDIEGVNAVIQQQHKDKSLQDVLNHLHAVHERMIAKIESLEDDDLKRAYKSYDSNSTADDPVIWWVVGNTYGHYEEHIPWIKAIVGVV